MANIAFYSDSFGWGHATRDAAFMREWAQKRPADRVYWRVGGRVGAECKRLAAGWKNIFVQEISDGISFAADGVGIDVEGSRGPVLEWFGKTEGVEAREREFLKKSRVDLVFSDIRPEALNAAEGAGIPSFAISNFSWSLICKKNWEGEGDLHAYLDGAYSLADISFVLPLNEPCAEMANGIRAPFLARKIGRKMKREVGGEKRVLINFGKSAREESVEIPGGAELVEIPKNETEGQDYVQLADFVVSKASYGICSEAVQAKVPCMLKERGGFEEGKYVLGQMVENGWGVQMGERIDFRLFEAKREWKEADFGFFEFAMERLGEYLGD